MIALPPVEAGAAQVRDICALPEVPARVCTADGVVRGMIAELEAEAVPLPAVLTAVTRKM